MTDEEKQAIEKIHNGKKMDLISIIRTFKREGIEKFVVTKKETVETVLNLIEKQQAEIRQYDKALHDQIIKDYDMEVELKAEIEMSNKVIHKRNEEKLELASMCLKKDKIIDEMAKTLKWSFNTGLGLIPSSICDCEGDIRNCEDKICTDCIKEYFKKKVEEI